ncbi:uncharacterized protein LOC129803279 [Phlebotomus papatasi]|uniref:uncharacterized protein LOC129803279 n=1 Tax=Phlebotomus papatasi TaxID=29031 RepID=UPI00248411C0|nr:uncharacterized protein LOC129803279 [Phlebotomus papatasi]
MANIKSRSAYKGQLTSVKTAISRYHEDKSLLSRDGARAYLETNLEICDRIRVRYNRVQDEIINQAESEEEREREIEEQNNFLLEIDEAEEKLTELIVNIKVNESAKKDLFHSTVIEDERIDKLLDGFSKLVERMDGSENSKYSKLEPVKIPTFNGEYAQWRSFKEMFINLVDSNKKLSKTQKLHHLKTKLTGKAFDAIDHLDMCDESYDIAWETITNRFECKKKVINGHIERIKSLPTLKNPIVDDLRNIYDVSTTTINAMDALKVNTRDPWIIYEVLSKLDHETQTLWSQEQSDVPTWDEFKVFLNKRCKALDLCPSTYTSNVNSSGSKVQIQKQKIVKSLTISKENSSQKHESCSVCKKSAHKLWKCGKFKSFPAAKRLETVNNLNLCMNCISESRSQHAVEKCPYPPCKHCNKSHNYWVHDALSNPPSKVTQDNPQSVSEDQKKPAVLSSFLPSNKSANGEIHRSILKTACVRILDSQQNVHVCRALLDFGSEISVMTTELCQRLRLKLQKSPYTQVEGFQGQVSSLKHQVNAILIPQINPRDVRVPTGFVLVDSEWHVSRPIDLLIGAAHEDEIMLDEVYKMGPGIPSLRNTVFGWVVCGKWQPNGAQSADTPPVCHTISLKTIDETLRKFWELEELSEECPQTVEYREVEELYSSTTKRSENGQYNVRLPLKGNFGELGSNRKRASRQLNFLERRLSQNPQLYKEYSNIFEEYLSLGIIERVPLIELQAKSYYMTHHCVVRENASSTKVRIVFNCGSVSETGISLNDVIKVGPVVQPELIEILWRFRRFPIALSCDIVKMYLQVQLNEDHRDLQRFLWRTSPSEPIMDYRFKTLCFGNAASPYLATKTLIKLAEDEGESYPRVAEVLRNNFYVDDCLLSVETTKEAIEVKKDLISLLGKAQMKLSKWQSNSPTVLQTLQEGNTEAKEVSISDGCVKALGLMWNPSNDTFSFQVDTMVENLVPTKRNILRVVARIYDPLGLLASITINTKLILQNLWKNEVDWDTEVEGDILREWKKFIASLQHIPSMRISRWTSKNENVCEEQLHMFSDASNLAYGAAVYHVTKDVSGRISSQMLTAKSKVAPIKTKTIPKLELCAATLGAKLLAKVAKSLKISKVYCWVDAKVVLAQIASASNKQDVFTKNRVTTIRVLTAVECWRHVPTKENPADLISRGTTAMELDNSSLYWEGPHWLKESDLARESKESVPPAVEESQDISVATLTVNKPEAQTIKDQTINQNITWHFQPARSPHFNGLVEAAVKSAKTHLKKVIGEQRLNYEKFYTILTQVEAVLNSRPITILSDDPRDPQPLTPGHFLLLAPPTQLPDENLASVRMNHLTRWQLCQRIVQDFVRKWRLSYLHTLQERSKKHTEKENLKVDDIVILHDASIGNTKWTTGRVVGVHTGADGKVRVIDIKTPTGTYTRSVTKVAKFPTCESHNLPREHV